MRFKERTQCSEDLQWNVSLQFLCHGLWSLLMQRWVGIGCGSGGSVLPERNHSEDHVIFGWVIGQQIDHDHREEIWCHQHPCFHKTHQVMGFVESWTDHSYSFSMASWAEVTRPGGPQKPDYVRCGPQTKLRSLGATITLLYFLGNFVCGVEHGFYCPIYWAESFQLTFIFFRGVGIPPTRNISTVIGYKPTSNWGATLGRHTCSRCNRCYGT